MSQPPSDWPQKQLGQFDPITIAPSPRQDREVAPPWAAGWNRLPPGPPAQPSFPGHRSRPVASALLMAAVSYTHLDVYKRQVQEGQLVRLEPLGD